MMSCCAAKTGGTTKPVSSAPLRGSLAAAWQLPKLAAQPVSAFRLVPVNARKSRLYERDCSRLI